MQPVNDVAPILSVGYVYALTDRLLITGDVGAIFTDGFTVDLSNVGDTDIPPEFLEQEEVEFRGDAWDAFPFVSLSIAYRF